MKTLNQQIADYTELLRQGELQIAYRSILNYMGKLRSDFAALHPEYEISGSIYQGYLDMTYFSVIPAALKAKGLKIAVVYLHEKGSFEVWLSARNRATLRKYKPTGDSKLWHGFPVFHDPENGDAALEFTLTSEPDFDEQNSLTQLIVSGTEKFISAVTTNLLME